MKADKRVMILSIFVAFITTFAIYRYMDNLISVNDEANFKQVWVANQEIPMKTKITTEMLEEKRIREDLMAKGAVTNENEVIGKYALYSLVEGEQVVESKVADVEKTYFSYNIPKNQRAITVEVDQVSGVADLVRPGDYVDVLVFFEEHEIASGGTKKNYPNVSKDMLQKVMVISVDKNFEFGSEPPATEVEDSERKRMITLSVNAWDAEKVVLAQEKGSVHLALRNPEDNDVQETNGAIQEDIVNR